MNTTRIVRHDRRSRSYAFFFALAVLSSASLAEAQVCGVGNTVAPGTCVCPSGTSFRLTATQANTCPTMGACVCEQGSWTGSTCYVAPPTPSIPSCPSSCPYGTACLNGACVKTGPIQVSLVWDTPGDLDLRVVTPSGREISYMRRSQDGGEMDRDDLRGTGPENIYWQSTAPQGEYHICVDSRLRRSRGGPVPTARFTVGVTANGTTQQLSGQRTGTEVERNCRRGGRTYVGSFVVSGGMTPSVPSTPGGDFGSGSSFNGATTGNIYFLPQNTRRLPTNWSQLSPVGSIYADRWNIAPRNFSEGFPGVTSRFEWFAIRYQGQFQVSRAGSYTFRLVSDDGAKLLIDGRVVVDNDGQHEPRAVSATTQLSAGIHSIEMQYFQGPQYQIALQLFVTPPGRSEQLFVTTGL